MTFVVHQFVPSPEGYIAFKPGDNEHPSDRKSYVEKKFEREAARQGGNEVRTASRRSMLDILPGLVPNPLGQYGLKVLKKIAEWSQCDRDGP